MQKQTFEQIKEQERIKRLEYWIVGGMGCSSLLTDIA